MTILSAFSPGDLPPIASWTPIADVGWPRRMMPAVHLSGCNFRCPYCLNRELVAGPPDELEQIDAKELIDHFFLIGERHLMISGAEPFMTPHLDALLSYIRFYKIRRSVATNGFLADRIRETAEKELVNHFVVDVKAALEPDAYSRVTGTQMTAANIETLKESLRFISQRMVPWTCEFRTTMCARYVSKDDLFSIAEFLGEDAIMTLQLYTTHQTLAPELADSALVIPYETLCEWGEELERIVFKVFVSEV